MVSIVQVSTIHTGVYPFSSTLMGGMHCELGGGLQPNYE